MNVEEVMTKSPACCTPGTSLKEVAQLMKSKDCGAIPVVDKLDSMHLVGIVTDRDITCRTIAQGKNPLQLRVNDCMTKNPATVTPDMTLEQCCALMEERSIRRVPVVDRNGVCCGVVAQADIAQRAPDDKTAEVVKRISSTNSHIQDAAH